MCGALILTFKNQSPAKTLKSKLTFKDIEGNLFFLGSPPAPPRLLWNWVGIYLLIFGRLRLSCPCLKPCARCKTREVRLLGETPGSGGGEAMVFPELSHPTVCVTHSAPLISPSQCWTPSSTRCWLVPACPQSSGSCPASLAIAAPTGAVRRKSRRPGESAAGSCPWRWTSWCQEGRDRGTVEERFGRDEDSNLLTRSVLH